MRRLWPPSMVLAATIVAAATAPPPAHAIGDPTNLPGDFVTQGIDRWLLQRHQARLQADMSRGDANAVNRDLYRLGNDEWRLERDRWKINHDLWRPEGSWARYPYHNPTGYPAAAPLIPHPLYPGYGYHASNPAQLYLLQQPVAAPSPAASAPGSGPTATPSTAPAAAPISVVVVNAGPPGTAIDYVVNGVFYRIDGGQEQRLTVSPKSTIVYDRGGNLGPQRYTLSAGTYEFRSGDTGWALFKRRPGP